MDVSQEIYDIARMYLRKVQRSGPDNVMASCPFHGGGEERHPSFALSLTKGLFFCHSCHAKGSLYTFLRKLDLGRQEIQIRYGWLLDEASKNIPATPDPKRPANVWVSLETAIDESLLGLFEHDVNHLLPGFEEETLKYFDVGWDGWHQRLTYPVHDMQGALVALSGRAIHSNERPKYKIYTEEYKAWGLPVRKEWDKRSVLWNGYQVYPSVFMSSPTDSFVMVVEGFKAAMWVWQAGIRNVVALLGSYMSWEQQWILERLGVPVYLFLDNNRPGKRGQLDAAERLQRSGCSVRLVEYPERIEDDPDAQPDSLDEDEVRMQKAKSPQYIDIALAQHRRA